MKTLHWIRLGFVLLGCSAAVFPSAANVAISDRSASHRLPPTTRGSLAFANACAQLEAAERRLARSPDDPTAIAMTIEGRLLRGRISGRIQDWIVASDVAERAVRSTSGDPSIHLLRARTRTTLHDFEGAAADLTLGEHEPGADRRAYASLRATIAEARGDLGAALALRTGLRQERPDAVALGMEGVVLARLDRIAEAKRTFEKALSAVHDVSPFTLGWLLFEEGVIWENEGDRERARASFSAAHDVLPDDVHIAMHLAALVSAPIAVTMLEPLASLADDPEVEWALVQRLRAAGSKPEELASRLVRIGNRFEALAAKHPNAFAGHAAAFFAADGHDPTRAFELAR